MKYKYVLRCRLILDNDPPVDRKLRRLLKPLKKCTNSRCLVHIRKNKTLIIKLIFEEKLERDWVQLNLVSMFRDLKSK